MSSLNKDREIVVESLIEERFTALAGEVKRRLESIKDKVSGDDSGLDNLWDEFSEQLAGQHSIFFGLQAQFVWDACEDVISDMGAFEVAILGTYSDGYLDWWTRNDVEPSMPMNSLESRQWVLDELHKRVVEEALKHREDILFHDQTEETFSRDQMLAAIKQRMQQLLMEDEANDWQATARWLDSLAIEKGVDLYVHYDSAWRWSSDFVDTMQHRVDFETLANGESVPDCLASFETAEELFYWILSPLHVPDR